MTTQATASPADAPSAAPAWNEVIPPGEDAKFRGFADELRAMAARRAARRHKAPDRALHVKAHVGVVGELEIGSAVPAACRVGPFAEAGRRWPVYVRFSNGGADRRADGAPDLRGLAIKLVGVPGAKVIPGLEGALTQDFLFVNVPAVPFKTPEEFLSLLRSADKGPLLLLPRLVFALGLGRTLGLLKSLAGLPKPDSLATIRYFTAAPVRMGQTAAHLGLSPVGAAPSAPAKLSKAAAAQRMRHDLVQRLGGGPLTFSLNARLYQDERTTPIEDASVVWPGPDVELGRLHIARQDVVTARGQEIEALVERFSFDPWHALPELRPLGAVMRARGHAYRESVIGRAAADEPTAVLSPG
jgi:hypothetical protein